MNLTKQNLLEIFETKSWNPIKTYMGRAEFSHITFAKEKGKGGKGNYYYCNITEQDIDKLKTLLNRKKGHNYYV